MHISRFSFLIYVQCLCLYSWFLYMFHQVLQIWISGFLQRSSTQVQWSEGEESGAPDANGEGFQGP